MWSDFKQNYTPGRTSSIFYKYHLVGCDKNWDPCKLSEICKQTKYIAESHLFEKSAKPFN